MLDRDTQPSPTTPNRSRFTRRQKIGATIVGAALALGGGAVVTNKLTSGGNEKSPTLVSSTDTGQPAAGEVQTQVLPEEGDAGPRVGTQEGEYVQNTGDENLPQHVVEEQKRIEQSGENK